MIHFRTEIRNSPKEQTLKIYLVNVILNDEVKKKLESFDEIRLIEIRETMGRNRVPENITVFREEGVDINVLKTKIDYYLAQYFER